MVMVRLPTGIKDVIRAASQESGHNPSAWIRSLVMEALQPYLDENQPLLEKKYIEEPF